MPRFDNADTPENGSAPGQNAFLSPTPILAELEKGPWPSFVSGFKTLAERTRKPMLRGVIDQLEYSYQTKTGYPALILRSHALH